MSLDYSLSVDEMPRAWTPKVGDRVRIRLSAECDRKVRAVRRGTSIPVTEPISHFLEADGLTGVIDQVDDERRSPTGHRFGVAFDAPIIVFVGGKRVRLHGEGLAITELEPISEAAR